MNTPIEDIFSAFNKSEYKEQVRNALRYSKTVYEKYGKRAALDVVKNKLYYIKNDNGEQLHFTLIQLFLYRTAYYANMKHFKSNWTINELREIGINEYWRRDPWIFKDQHILKSVDDFTSNDIIKYEYNFNKDRYDFEFKFSKKFDYNILLKSTWTFILSQYCKSNCIGNFSNEERELIYNIISKLDTSYKQNIIDILSAGVENDILSLISTIQDDLLIPMEFAMHIICNLLIQRKLFIFSGDNGRINSYIYNGNVVYDIAKPNGVFSLPIYEDITHSSIVSVALFSKQLSASKWITNTLFAGTISGKIIKYNFDNCTWDVFVNTNNYTVKLFIVDTKLVVVNKINIQVFDILTVELISTININDILGGTSINCAHYYSPTNTLILSDDIGNIGSVIDVATNPIICIYTSSSGVALNNINNLNENISCLDVISFKNENDLTETKNVLCVGFENGAICSYYIDTDVWIYVNGTQNKESDSCYIKAYDDGQIFNDKIIKFIFYETNLFIFTESGKMGSYGVYNGGFTNANGTDIFTSGPGHYGNLSGYGKITSVVIQNTYSNIRFIISTDTGNVLIYYVSSKTWDYENHYLNNILGNQTTIRDAFIYEIPFTEMSLISDIIFRKHELYNNKDKPITNRY